MSEADPASGALAAVGNTPIIALRRCLPASGARVLLKWEPANPTGSMKDRMAVEVIRAAARDGRLAAGDTVVEYTAGTTGVSLAFVCAALGYRLHVVFSDAFSVEKRQTMNALGAQITDEPSDNGRITEELIRRMISTAGRLSEQPGHWWADQLNNEDALAGYFGLGEEIAEQTDGRVDVFIQAVSTAHSIHGTAQTLRQHVPGVKVIAVEPAESAVLSGAPTGAHHIEGIGIGFIPPLWKPHQVDGIETVSSREAQDMARRLAREEGIFAGTSTGANVVANRTNAAEVVNAAIATERSDGEGTQAVRTGWRPPAEKETGGRASQVPDPIRLGSKRSPTPCRGTNPRSLGQRPRQLPEQLLLYDAQLNSLTGLVFDESFCPFASSADRSHELTVNPVGLQHYEDQTVVFPSQVVNTCKGTQRHSPNGREAAGPWP